MPSKAPTQIPEAAENWELNHPNLKAVREQLRESGPDDARVRTAEQELHGAMLTDFIRRTHGQRSADFVRTRYGSDLRLSVANTHLAEFVARLALSHVQDAEALTSPFFQFDESIATYSANMVYLGLLLRLADIMDFDRDRTPDSLYRTIDFQSGVSLAEWEKHRSVNGWKIDSKQVQYTLRCTQPEYQRAAYQFMDWIDHELGAAYRMLARFPAAVARYRLELPLKVDRSRIEPKDGAYLYRDLEFSLSRDEIVSLLMTTELYGAPHLCVRELLQNSLDALRHRRALMIRDGVEWRDGRVDFVHELDPTGYDVLRCIDNGVGMDEDVIERFLTRAGRSYYRSPEFERERAGFRKVDADFDPCAQFGIGFMSTFMIGDRIVIRTRRDYGPARGRGKPLVVEINGLGGMLVIRPGTDSQEVGTTVEIRGRTKRTIIDDHDDQVNLVTVINGYAIATEFPVAASCTVPGIEAQTEVPTTLDVPRTELERAGVQDLITLEERFAEVDSRLNGAVRASFLADERGFAHSIGSLRWQPVKDYARPRDWRVVRGDTVVDWGMMRSPTAIDGILVAGPTGRSGKRDRFLILAEHANPINLGRSAFLLDVRGDLKPALTAARVPPDRMSPDESWRRLRAVAGRAWGRLWEQVASLIPDQLDDELFWFLAAVYDAGIKDMSMRLLWSHAKVPIAGAAGTITAHWLSSLGPFYIEMEKGGLSCDAGAVQPWPDAVGARSDLEAAIVAACRVDLVDGRVALLVSDAASSDMTVRDRMASRGMFEGAEFLVPFGASVQKYLVAEAPYAIINEQHPVVVARARTALPTAARRFFSTIVRWATDGKMRAAFINGDPPDWWTSRIGRLFHIVDWSAIEPALHPPYWIVRPDGSPIEITRDTIDSWARHSTDGAP